LQNDSYRGKIGCRGKPVRPVIIRRVNRTVAILLLAVFPGTFTSAQTLSRADTVPPSIEYGELYQEVELQPVFPDSKTFPDMIPDAAPGKILADYEASRHRPGFDLRYFVARHFHGPRPAGPEIRPAAKDESLSHYVARLWPLLQQSAQIVSSYSSLLPLPFPYAVPGGRFREVYYWDSYFTMLGLAASRQQKFAESLLRNFAFETDRYGHISNGNRSYYLSRSQPPVFSLMVDLIAARKGESVYATYLSELRREYAFWMEGAASLRPGQAHRRVVRLQDGTLLNRYWDDRPVPRDESYREDVETARHSQRRPSEIYRNLRAAAESGWDFSSRWLADDKDLATIRTISLLPVDLNSLLMHLEATLARAYRIAGDSRKAARFDARATRRSAAIRRLMWNKKAGLFTDYLWQQRRASPAVTAAGVFPLFFGIAEPEQAKIAAETLRRDFLMPGGLATTTVTSGQQWDQPNGWAPLQWVAVIGLRNYGETGLAQSIAERWVASVIEEYELAGKLVEKYNVTMVCGSLAGSGGEYATQIGFGWTNGVLIGLAKLYPALAEQVEAARPMPQARRRCG
jgi:alpha,alpha-trehalase